MKKLLTLLLCFALVLSLCACGGKTDDTSAGGDQDAVVTPGAIEDPAGDLTGEDSATGEEYETSEGPADSEENDPVAEKLDIVKQYIDKPLADLIAVIGEPQSRDYAPSCLGDGEDGLLVYDGFVVYTYREGDSEIVYDVE